MIEQATSVGLYRKLCNTVLAGGSVETIVILEALRSGAMSSSASVLVAPSFAVVSLFAEVKALEAD